MFARLTLMVAISAAWMLPVNELFARGGGGHGGGGHGGGGHHGGEHHEAEHHSEHHEAEHHAEHHEAEHHEEHHAAEHHDADHHLNDRPGWNDLNHDQHATAHDAHRNAWDHHDADHDVHNWLDHHPERRDHYHHWADHVRDHNRDHHHAWDHHGWWRHHYPYANHWWNYNHYWNNYPWSAWWTAPAWGAIDDWFPDYGWNDGVYYDYGQDGNVYQNNEDNTTYIAGQPAGSAADYAKSAAELATVDPPADDAANANTQWLPLGNFALSTGEEDTEPTRVLQLAVDKQGVISGMLYNEVTKKSLPVQGSVDKDTQRVAFRIGGNRHVVFETGIYNLTQAEAPALIHFGADRTQNALLVRLDAPANDDDGNVAAK